MGGERGGVHSEDFSPALPFSSSVLHIGPVSRPVLSHKERNLRGYETHDKLPPQNTTPGQAATGDPEQWQGFQPGLGDGTLSNGNRCSG